MPTLKEGEIIEACDKTMKLYTFNHINHAIICLNLWLH